MVTMSMNKEDVMAALESLHYYIVTDNDKGGEAKKLYNKILEKAKKESPLTYKNWY